MGSVGSQMLQDNIKKDNEGGKIEKKRGESTGYYKDNRQIEESLEKSKIAICLDPSGYL